MVIIEGEGQTVFMVDSDDNIYLDYYLDDDLLVTNYDDIEGSNPIEVYSTNDTINIYKTYNNSLPNLPDIGRVCEQDTYYKYNSDIVYCIQTHNRTKYELSEIPALFRFYREDTGDLEWIPNEKIGVGDIRVYQEVSYECIQLHTTQLGWEPNITPALWGLVASESDEWQAGISYTIDDLVMYNDVEYKCRQSHTSLVGWEPPNVLALWLPT